MKTLLFILVIGNLLLLGLVFTPNPNVDTHHALPPLPPGVRVLQQLSERAAEPPTEAGRDQASKKKSSQKKVTPTPNEGVEISKTGNVDDKGDKETSLVVKEEVNIAAPVCHTIGPFAKEDSASEFVARLNETGTDSAMRQSEIQEPAGYWVYLPSMERSQAEEIVEQLKTNKVEDYFLGAQNFISLGIYSGQSTAQDRFEQITDLGYQPKLEQRFKIRDVYWLDVEERGSLLTEDDWAQMMETSKGVRRQNLACE